MKFAKQLNQDAIPEWKAKFLDYRLGKRKVKAIEKAYQRTHPTPRTPAFPRLIRSSTTHGRSSDWNSQGQAVQADEVEEAESSPLRNGRAPGSQTSSSSYGSIHQIPSHRSALNPPSSLQLPDPALSPSAPFEARNGATTVSGDAYEIGKTHSPTPRTTLMKPRRTFSTPHVPLEPFNDASARQAEFFLWLDSELKKIESFYVEKETEALKTLGDVKQQLKIMRERGDAGRPHRNFRPDDIGGVARSTPTVAYKNRDFDRRNKDDVSPNTARKQLKLAMQEYYRTLELLRSYAFLNQTAFRKLNKKYDKAINADIRLGYMSEVSNARFGRNQEIDTLIEQVEKLYAEYFEGGNKKHAASKLRSKTTKHSYTGSVFRNGIYLAAGTMAGLLGLVDGIKLLEHESDALRNEASFLLQLYGGYFLCDFLVLLFVLVCRIWDRSHINYVFIFEFDTRHYLNWRQLGELPSLFMLFLGMTLWLNFQQFGHEYRELFIWWPVVLIGATGAVLFFPYKGFYHRSRRWWLYSILRLMAAGFVQVEFRDFFLGDMFCSLTYAMGNIEVFFCVYAKKWNNTDQCKSSNSIILGFLTCLPGIWRALQCLKRYRDAKDWRPHIPNFFKYLATCMFYMSLSLWRIHNRTHFKVLFILFATINSIYVSVWDLLMDWSLIRGPRHPKYPLLREKLGYKQVWMYYVAMIIDPIIRFNWVLYIIVSAELQHSAILSFFIAFSEVCRRGMWAIFRVENEHCTNVGKFRASRDIELPYELTLEGSGTA